MYDRLVAQLRTAKSANEGDHVLEGSSLDGERSLTG